MAVAAHHVVGPAVHLHALLGVEAHELADDDQRHVDREVLDEVDLALLPRRPSISWSASSRMWGTSSRTRRGVNPGLTSRRGPDVLLAVERDDRHVAGDDRPDAEPVAVQVGMPGEVEDLLVAARDPELVALVAVQRSRVAQRAVHGPGVVEERGLAEVEGFQVDSGGGGGHPGISTNVRSIVKHARPSGSGPAVPFGRFAQSAGSTSAAISSSEDQASAGGQPPQSGWSVSGPVVWT